jgi:PhzF family phenazine biosynthesis protein
MAADARASLEIWQVDVFSDRPLAGNPAAVVFGADGLPGEVMQAIARETNLSETVFILPATTAAADFRARIFTTRREIPFAGHPALAAGHAWLEAGGGEPRAVLMQECGIGNVEIHRRGDAGEETLVVALPRSAIRPSGWSAAEAATLFGLPADRVLSADIPVAATGVPWVMVEVAGIADLAALTPDHGAIARATRAARAVGVTVFARHPGAGGERGAKARLRTFAPAEGIYEDPVCGSCHGSLAALLLSRGELPRPDAGESVRIVTEQGHEISRPGIVEITVEGSSAEPTLWLGGRCVTVMRGRLFI